MLDWSHANEETEMIRIVTAAALAFLAATPAVAGQVDIPADGTYTKACLPTVTCLLSIERAGKGRWNAEFRAVDNRPNGKTFCQYKTVLKVGVAEFTSGAEFDALVGPIEGGQIGISGSSEGLMAVTDVGTCERTSLPRSRGLIVVNGSYDVEGDF